MITTTEYDHMVEKDAKILECLAMKEKLDARILDLKFVDILGVWQHCSYPVTELTEDKFEEGFGFDGSSITGFQKIHESDMLLLADPATVTIDPFFETLTLTMIANVQEAITYSKYDKDPRYVAQKAEKYLKETGIADISYWGPELEFFVFDSVSWDVLSAYGGQSYTIHSSEAAWEANKPGSGHRPMFKKGYFPVPPTDSMQDLRSEIVLTMQKIPGMKPECHHHEVATAGQAEIDLRYNSLTKQADNVLWHKYIVKNVVKNHGMTATFMPKPIFGDNGSGMHVHQSLWKHDSDDFEEHSMRDLSLDTEDPAELSQMERYYIGSWKYESNTPEKYWVKKKEKTSNGYWMAKKKEKDRKPRNIFFDPEGPAELSQTALYYIGGLLEHINALVAITSPTTNSYRRLVPGYEAPNLICYSQRNRSAAIRIPMYYRGKKYANQKRMEFRPPDPLCNPYLAFSAMLMAGLDGIKKKINPGEMINRDIYEVGKEERKKLGIREVVGSLDKALDCLESDIDFLKAGNVFTSDLLDSYIEIKREEVAQTRIRPHPYEFYSYYNM